MILNNAEIFGLLQATLGHRGDTTGQSNPYMDVARAAERATISKMSDWYPIETAPKSKADGRQVHGHFILGFCPDPDIVNLESCVCVIWWEPLMNKGNGLWMGEGGVPVNPTMWSVLKAPPALPSKFIDDEHDIENGQILNPEWVKIMGRSS